MSVIKASAPGSIMLFGEHAVVRGGLGIAASLLGRIYVTLRPRVDRQVTLRSDRFTSWQCALDHLTHDDTHAYTLGVLRHFQPKLQQGVDIEIQSDLSPTHGFGSSAALVVALVAALQQQMLSKSQVVYTRDRSKYIDSIKRRQVYMTHDAKLDIAAIARAVIIDVQGQGSGCDAYTSTLGGIVAIRANPQNQRHSQTAAGEVPTVVQQLAVSPPLTAIYTGYKTKTAVVLAKVAAEEAKSPAYYADLFQRINSQTQAALTYLQVQDWPALGQIMREQFHLQQALGIADATTVSIMDTLEVWHTKTGQPWGAKISGSGLGDCLIALGELPANQFPCQHLPDTQQFDLTLGTDGVNVTSETKRAV